MENILQQLALAQQTNTMLIEKMQKDQVRFKFA